MLRIKDPADARMMKVSAGRKDSADASKMKVSAGRIRLPLNAEKVEVGGSLVLASSPSVVFGHIFQYKVLLLAAYGPCHPHGKQQSGGARTAAYR
jgi:hypothetical protein